MEQFPVNLSMYTAVVGFFLPGLIAIINRCGWDAGKKYGISFAVVCVAAIGHLIFAGQWDMADVPGSILKMLFMTIGSYLVFWRPSVISDKIEQSINPGPTVDCK